MARLIDDGMTPVWAGQGVDKNAYVDAALERVGLLLRDAPSLPEPPFADLIQEAQRIHIVGGFPGFGSVGVAAFMMRERLEALRRACEWDAEGLNLFYDALRFLHRGDQTGGCHAVLNELDAIAKRDAEGVGADCTCLGRLETTKGQG